MALVHVVLLKLLKVTLEVGNVLNNLLQDVIGSLGGVVLERGTFRTQELHVLLVIIEKLGGFFRAPL